MKTLLLLASVLFASSSTCDYSAAKKASPGVDGAASVSTLAEAKPDVRPARVGARPPAPAERRVLPAHLFM